MRILSVQSFEAFLSVLLFSFLLFNVSCNSRENNLKEGSSAMASQNKIKAPNIDLHTAVLTDNHEAVQQHILAGSNLNEKDPFGGSSPLITAAVFGKTEMAGKLIEAGADINFKNNDGSTAINTAAFFCRPEIVDMLLKNGADKTIRNKFGATAYESVTAPFDEVKNVYDMMGKMLAPMGLKLDYEYIRKTRPEIAAKLR